MPVKVLVDGNRLPDAARCRPRPSIGGDAKVQAISAASILAKVHRDRLCLTLHEEHPQYGFDGHKGYCDARAPGGAARARRLPAPPAQLRAGARRRSTGCSMSAVADVTHDHARATTRCSCTCASCAHDPARVPQARRGLARGRSPVRGACSRAAARRRTRVVSESALAASRRCADWPQAAPTRRASSPTRCSPALSALESPAPIGFVRRRWPARRRRCSRRAERRPRPAAGRRQRRQRSCAARRHSASRR